MIIMFLVGGGLEDSQCVPYVSQYTDCSDANACSGCTRCSCNETGNWECQKVIECPPEEDISVVDDVALDNALDVLYEGLEEKKKREPGSLVPPPRNPEEDLLLDKKIEMEEELKFLMGRQKRSVYDDRNNATVKFYETVDEINEDTLKDLNSSGTIAAHKVNALKVGKRSRRTELYENHNVSANDLHIEYNKPHELEHHIAENKVDSTHPSEDKINGLSHEEIHKILGNYSQVIKNKNLSSLVVNELTLGSERIGDKNVVPVSNITFTPENDTLTAMTYIAGNLLNKLWDMEKDANEGSYETEVMKHEKINDLLELFKEPLTLRQETFLKEALEKLSRVVDKNKDIRNMSLCANIGFPETIKLDNNNCTEKSIMMNEHGSSMIDLQINNASFESKNRVTAISKINEVLSLMKKYEQLQKKISDIKSLPKSEGQKSIVAVEEKLSMDENISLNLFGKLLDKITNLLSPNKNGKNINKRVKSYNMLREDNIAKKNLENIFNVNLANTALSAKDRMISDYLGNIEKHPNCFFTHLQKSVVTPLSNVEGSILYNLSEFFKIKSLTDLLKVASDKPDTMIHNNTIFRHNTSYPTNAKQNKSTVLKLRSNAKSKNSSLELAKEKLKNDIKNILQDLFDLQKEHGIKSKSNIDIAEALPCIYNILKSNDDNRNDNLKNNAAITSINKVSAFIDSLKLDMKFVVPNRRTNINISSRPKSAVVWERTIKNLNKKFQKATRRFLSENPKTYKELREMMDKVELSRNTYKNFAVHSGVAPSERLILLKTLEADVKQYTNVLDAIKQSFTILKKLPLEKQNEFHDFIDNAAININLDKKLVAIITKLKINRSENIKPSTRVIDDFNQSLKMIPKWAETNVNNNFKLKRDQIMNQLIMNRLRLYIKNKERTEIDLNANANYNIAKRILFHLENGNIALAKELYKVFLANKQPELSGESNTFSEYHDKDPLGNNEKRESRETKLFTFNEPLIRVEDAKKTKMLTQDYLLKQLWNLKELKE